MVYSIVSPGYIIKPIYGNEGSTQEKPERYVFYVFPLTEELKWFAKNHREIVLDRKDNIFCSAEKQAREYFKEIIVPKIQRIVESLDEASEKGFKRFMYEIVSYQYMKDIIHTALSTSAKQSVEIKFLSKEEFINELKKAKEDYTANKKQYKVMDKEASKDVLRSIMKTTAIGFLLFYHTLQKEEANKDSAPEDLGELIKSFVKEAEKLDASSIEELIVNYNNDSDNKEVLDAYKSEFGHIYQILNKEHQLLLDSVLDTAFTLMISVILDEMLKEKYGQLSADISEVLLEALSGIKKPSGSNYII